MQIFVNANETEIADGATLLALIEVRKLVPARVLASVNDAIIPPERYAAVTLRPGDRVDLFSFVSGG